MIDLSVITVTYNSKEFIADCILSLQLHCLNIQYEHIIVDNGSTDGTKEYVQDHFGEKVVFLEAGDNVGFARGNQRGVEKASGRYHLFLNPDMRIDDGWLDTLVQWMDEHTEVGLATCRLVTERKKTYPFLTPTTVPHLQTFAKSLSGMIPFSVSLNRDTLRLDFQDDQIQWIENARGSFFFLRASLGLSFDTSYFLLLEDLDLCNTVRKAGYVVAYFPNITCIDFYNQSFLHTTSAWYYLIAARSMKTYISKWHGSHHLLWCIPLAALGFFCRIPFWGIKTSIQAYKTYRHNMKIFTKKN